MKVGWFLVLKKTVSLQQQSQRHQRCRYFSKLRTHASDFLSPRGSLSSVHFEWKVWGKEQQMPCWCGLELDRRLRMCVCRAVLCCVVRLTSAASSGFAWLTLLYRLPGDDDDDMLGNSSPVVASPATSRFKSS